MIRSLEARDRRMSSNERSQVLCFFKLRFALSHNIILLFNTFNTHSVMIFNRSLLQLKNDCFTQLRPCILQHQQCVIMRLYSSHLFSSGSIDYEWYRPGNILVRNRSRSTLSREKSNTKFPCVFGRVKIRLVRNGTVRGIHLACQVCEVILVSNVL